MSFVSQLAGAVTFVAAVEQELAVGRAQGVNVPDLNLLGWLQIRALDSASTIPNVIDLDRGEAEVIALRLEDSGSL